MITSGTPGTIVSGAPALASTPVPEPTKTTEAPGPVPAMAAPDIPKQPEARVSSERPAQSEPGATPTPGEVAPTAEPTVAPVTEPIPNANAPISSPAPANGDEVSAKEEETAKEEAEPQNMLTDKFTKAEREALKEFRVCPLLTLRMPV